jgi:hypothetical protein
VDFITILKSLAVGVCTALLAVVAYVAASVSLDMGVGVGAATVALDTFRMALAAVGGFLGGFALYRRRMRHRRR